MRFYQMVCVDFNLNLIMNKFNIIVVIQVVFLVVVVVYVVVYVIDEIFKYYCGLGYSGICSNFQIVVNKGQVLLQKFDEVIFEVELGEVFRMKDESANFFIKYYNFKNGGFVEVIIFFF